MKKPPKPKLSVQPQRLAQRAKEEMDAWFSTLPYSDRRKLNMRRSPWGRDGGTIALGLRPGKTARTNKKLKRDREARLEAEQAAYEMRRTLQVPIEN